MVESLMLAAGASAGTASTVGTIVSGIGTLPSVMGAMSGGRAEQQRAQYEAQMRANEAQRERELGELRAGRKRDEAERLAATPRARMAGGGGNIAQGSALLAQEDLAEEGEFNALLLEADADAKVDSLMAERELSLAAGRDAMRSSVFRGGSTLLKSAAKFG